MVSIVPLSAFNDPSLIEKLDEQLGFDGSCGLSPAMLGDKNVDACEAEFALKQMGSEPGKWDEFVSLVPSLQLIRSGDFYKKSLVSAKDAEALVAEKIKGAKSMSLISLEGEDYMVSADDLESSLNDYLRRSGSTKRVALEDDTSGKWDFGEIMFERPYWVKGRTVWSMAFKPEVHPNMWNFGQNSLHNSCFSYASAYVSAIHSKFSALRSLNGPQDVRNPAEYKALLWAQTALGFQNRNLSEITDQDLRPLVETTVSHEPLHQIQFAEHGPLYEGMWYFDSVAMNGRTWDGMDESLTKLQTLIDGLEGRLPGVSPAQTLASSILHITSDRMDGRYTHMSSLVLNKVIAEGFKGDTGVNLLLILSEANKVRDELKKRMTDALAPNGRIQSLLRQSWGGGPFEDVKPRLAAEAVLAFREAQKVELKVETLSEILLWRSIIQNNLEFAKGRSSKAYKLGTMLKQVSGDFIRWLNSQYSPLNRTPSSD